MEENVSEAKINMPNKLVAVTVIVLNIETELLMTRTDSESNWRFPVAFVEEKEGLDYAAARAVKEVISFDFLEKSSLTYSGFVESENYVTFIYFGTTEIETADTEFIPLVEAKFFPMWSLPENLNQVTKELIKKRICLRA